MGNIADRSKKLDHAVENYSKAIELDPTWAQPYNDRGLVYSWQARLDQAIVDYTKAIDLDPKLASAYFGRAGVFRIKGDNAKALADFESYLRFELSPEERAWVEQLRDSVK